jgi:hypothetical protein
MLSRRQLSTTEKMAAIFGPASLLPRCSQFFLPIAIGLIEFSARFVLSSSSGCLRNTVSLLQNDSV